MNSDKDIDVVIVGAGMGGEMAARAFAAAGMMAVVVDIIGAPEKPDADAAPIPIRPMPHDVIIKMASIDAKIITAARYDKQQRHYQKIQAARHAPRPCKKPR